MASDPTFGAGAMPPPGVSPQDWYAQQRAQMLASALTQGAMSPIESPQTAPVRGLYVQPRVGIGQVASKLANALLSKQALNRSMNLYGQNIGAGLQAMTPGGQYEPTGDSVTVQTAPGQQVAPPSSPGEQSVQPPGGQTPPQTAQLPTFARTPVNPMNPTGMAASIALRAYVQDPAGYFKTIQGTPEWQNALRATGGDPDQAQQLIAAQLRKAGTTEARPGGWVQGPNGQWQQLPAGGPGQQLRLGPNGEITSQTIPGYNEQAGALEGAQVGAKESAEAPYTMIEIPAGGGRTMKMPLAQYLQQYGNGARVSPPTAPSAGAAPAASASPLPSLPAAPSAPLASSPIARAPTIGGAPAGPASPPPASASPAARPQGIWSTVPKLNVPVTPGMSSDTYTQDNLKAASDKKAELATKYGQDASLADARLAFNNEALGVLQGAETGPLSDELTKLRAKAAELGVPAQWIPGADTVNDTQLLKKFALRNPLLNLKPTFGGRPAAAEFQVLANDASPSPTMMKPVFARLVQLDSQQAQYAKQQAADFGRYSQMGGDPQQFEQWYANHRPLAGYFAQQSTPSAALARLQQHPELLPYFKQKYGWDPTQQ